MITEHDATVGTTRLRWATAGEGDTPLVLLHGLGWSWRVWMDVVPMLAADRRVIALDMPGHGESDAPHGSYSPAWFAGGVKTFLDVIGVERAVLVGNSLGGLTAAIVGATWPERVASLALISPALPNDEPPPDPALAAKYGAALLPVIGPIMYERFWGRDPAVVTDERLARNFNDPARISEALREHVVADAARRGRSPDALRAGVAATRQVVWAMTARRERTWNIVRSLQVPTAFLWGDSDRIVPPSIGERAVNEVPGSHLITLEDCGHTPQAEHPKALAGALSAFVRAADAASAVRT